MEAAGGRSVVVAQKPSKLLGRVRFPSPACTGHGEWRSLVAHPAGGRAVAGSNPVSPMKVAGSEPCTSPRLLAKAAKILGFWFARSRLFPAVPGTRDRKWTAGKALRSYAWCQAASRERQLRESPRRTLALASSTTIRPATRRCREVRLDALAEAGLCIMLTMRPPALASCERWGPVSFSRQA